MKKIFLFSATPVKGLEIRADAYVININSRIVLTNNFTGGTDTALTRLLKDNGATTANFSAMLLIQDQKAWKQ